jgi:hypothetical protein
LVIEATPQETWRITIVRVPGYAFEHPVAESESDARGGSF